MAAVVLGGVGYVFRHSLFPVDHSAGTQIQVPSPIPMAVTVVTAEARAIARRIAAGGTLVAREEVLVSAQVTGAPILRVLVDVGTEVTEGQPLAVLDGQRLGLLLQQKAADLARSKSTIAQAEALSKEAATAAKEARGVLTRTNALEARGAISEQVMEEKQAAAATAEARVEAQEQALSAARADLLRIRAERDELLWQREELTVRATAAGVVTERNAKVGQAPAADGAPLFRIMKDGVVEMEAAVIETALRAIYEGQPVTVTIPGDIHPVQGNVRLVAPSIDPVTRMGKVWIGLSGTALKPGSFANADFETVRREAIVVPHAALLAGDVGSWVQVVRDGVVTLRAVEIGLNTAIGIEIVLGLEPGEVVIANAGRFLREGSQITPMKAVPKPTGKL